MELKKDPFLESMIEFYRDFATRNDIHDDAVIPEGLRVLALNRLMHWSCDSSDQTMLPKYLS